MTPKTFRGYGVRSPDVTIVLERITHFYAIDYNGEHGTVIALDTGKEVKVGCFTHDVEQAIKDIK